MWFRRVGLAPGAALLWALGGVFCTPSWFYGTSTFDDILGTADRVSCTYRKLPQEVKVGDRLLVDDGRVALEVTGVTGNGGRLMTFKS